MILKKRAEYIKMIRPLGRPGPSSAPPKEERNTLRLNFAVVGS
jgi:hypothetical protein